MASALQPNSYGVNVKHPLSKAKNKKCAAPAAKILLCKNRNNFGKFRLDDEGVDVGGDDGNGNGDSDGGRGRLVGDEFDFSGDVELLDEDDYGGVGGFGGGGRPLVVSDIGGPGGLGGAPGPEYDDFSQSRVGRRNKNKAPRRKYHPGGRRRPARNRGVADPQQYSYYSYNSVFHYPISPITTTYENTYEYNLQFRNGRGRRPNKKLQRQGSRGPRHGSRHRYPQNYHRVNLGRASSEAETVSNPQYSYISYDTYVQYPILPPPLTTTTYENTYEYNLHFRNGRGRRPNKKLQRQGAQGPSHGRRYKKYPHAYSRASSEVDRVSDPQDFFLTYDTFEVLPAGYQGYYHPFEYIEFFNGRAAPTRKKSSKLLKNKKNSRRLAAVGKPQFFDIYDDYIPQLPYRRKPYYSPYGYDRSGKPRRRRNRAPRRPSKKTAARASDENEDRHFLSLTYDSSEELPYSPLPYRYPHRYNDYFRSRPGKKQGLRAAKRAIRSELGSSEPEEKRKLRTISSEETEDDDQRGPVARIAGDESSAAAADGELRQARADMNSGSSEGGPRARAEEEEADEEDSNRKKIRKRRGKSREKSKKKRKNKNKYMEASQEVESAAEPVTFGRDDELETEV